MTSESNQLTLRPITQMGLTQQRRGSFLYKADTPDNTIGISSCSVVVNADQQQQQHLLPTFQIAAMTTSATTVKNLTPSANASVSASPTFADHPYPEDQIVTPFAQILQRLQSARNNYVELTNVNDRRRRRSSNYNTDRDSINLNVGSVTTTTTTMTLTPTTSPSTLTATTSLTANSNNNMNTLFHEEFSLEILDDLDWCLDQLEAIQTHRSVGDLATSKFKRMLTKELSHLAESSKSGSQISEYISNTFLDKEDESCPLKDKKTTTSTSTTSTTPTSTKALNLATATKSSNSTTTKTLATTPTACFKSVTDTFIVRDKEVQDGGLLSCDVTITSSKFGVAGLDDDAVEEFLGSLTDWNLSVFTLDKMTNGRSLTVMAYTIFKQRDLTKKFNIPHATLLSYLALVEGHYNPMASYHNHIHATDVTHAVHVILKKAPLLDVFTDLEILSVIFSSIIHDVDHPGLTNNHLINTNSELALMYNDESVLENHHLAVAFKLMQRNQCDIFCNVPAKIRQRIRKMTIDMVLATDMSKHMSLLADMKTMVETKKVSGTGLQLSENYNERIQVLKCLLHCADLCNPAKHLPIYSQWIERVMQEFFNQGDIERDLGLDISPMCDRHTASVEKSQVGFIDFIVQPLWETWAELVDPYCNDILDEIETNRNYFQLLSDNNETSPHIMTSATTNSSKQDDKNTDTAENRLGIKSEKIIFQFDREFHGDKVVDGVGIDDEKYYDVSDREIAKTATKTKKIASRREGGGRRRDDDDGGGDDDSGGGDDDDNGGGDGGTMEKRSTDADVKTPVQITINIDGSV